MRICEKVKNYDWDLLEEKGRIVVTVDRLQMEIISKWSDLDAQAVLSLNSDVSDPNFFSRGPCTCLNGRGLEGTAKAVKRLFRVPMVVVKSAAIQSAAVGRCTRRWPGR